MHPEYPIYHFEYSDVSDSLHHSVGFAHFSQQTIVKSEILDPILDSSLADLWVVWDDYLRIVEHYFGSDSDLCPFVAL